ncbi:MAG TPA: relaxase/mobilization nuclease domain-containing protein [Candidatus Faecousia intestinigallinarum]|nr:relaxase/mobilization nuclease domain-containing protein [Candidatus Faecousia intestinigallinarum]
MAITKQWNVKDSLERPLSYVTQACKTDPRLAEDLMAFRDVVRWEGQAQEKRELEKLLGYTLRPDKTQEQFVTGIHCSPKTARLEMETVKARWHKQGGVLCVHAVQSFQPGEVSPELAHRIGCELAERIWGSRFQVVVSTHLDREHIHNHFVINSVSYADGKKFYTGYATYDEMRVNSDKLCLEYGLSIITRPKKGRLPTSKAYANAGLVRPAPHYQRIRQDIDEAVRIANSMTDFYRILSDKGYHFRQGQSLKYFSLRPPGAQRSTRIDRWCGEDYSLAGIARRIADGSAGSWTTLETAIPEVIRSPPPVRFRGQFTAPSRRSRFRGLYLYYCHLFGLFPRRQPRYPIDRSEVAKLRRLSKATRLLLGNHIDTREQLQAYRERREAEAMALCQRRKPLYNRLRGADETEALLLRQELEALNRQLRTVREEIHLCREIARRSAPQNNPYQTNTSETTHTTKEETDNGRIHRSRQYGDERSPYPGTAGHRDGLENLR